MGGPTCPKGRHGVGRGHPSLYGPRRHIPPSPADQLHANPKGVGGRKLGRQVPPTTSLYLEGGESPSRLAPSLYKEEAHQEI
jgi:hypothetical protein